MEKLKVGDKLVNEEKSQWSNDWTYTFAKVERLTATQAILDNGVRLKNEPHLSYVGVVEFGVVGDIWTKYTHITPEIIEKALKEKEKQATKRWFSNKRFSDEEIKIIYDHFKSMDKI